jgi:hypothetical protein
MAKNKSTFFDPSGTLEGFTFVKMDKGNFIRRPRGSLTPVKCNDSLQAQSRRTPIINKAAQLVHNAIIEYAGAFKKSDLWQDMQGLIRQSKQNDLLSLLQPLEGLEVHQRHLLQKIVADVVIDLTQTGSVVTMQVNAVNEPQFRLPYPVDSYYYEIFALFISEKWEKLDTEKITTGWVPIDDPRVAFEMSFIAPEKVKYYVLMLKVQAGKLGEEVRDFRAMGIRVMMVGEMVG